MTTRDQLQTIVDEAFGPFPTLPDEELLTLLERKLTQQRCLFVKHRSISETLMAREPLVQEVIRQLRAYDEGDPHTYLVGAIRQLAGWKP